MVTIEKIAKKLGVNKSTVSKALRGADDVGAETVKRVTETAKELGYVKKHDKKTGVIAVVVPEIDNAVYSEIANVLIKELAQKGFVCSVYSYNFDSGIFEKTVKSFNRKSVDGFFVVEENLSGKVLISSLKECALPFVLISGEDHGLNCDSVWINEKYGVEAVAKHLAELGHKKFAFIGDEFGASRAEAVRGAVKALGGELKDGCVVLTGKRGFACGYEGVDVLMDSGEEFTALVCHYDDVAIGALKRLKERGIKVPEDISITGFDGCTYCGYTFPSLTTVNTEATRLCGVAAAIILKKISGNASGFQSVLIRPDLVVGGSTGKA